MATDSYMPELRINLLGGFHVTLDGREVTSTTWRMSKPTTLLKLLALAPTHRLHREQVLDLLWPQLDERAARNNLYNALHSLRSTFIATNARITAADYLDLAQSQIVLCPRASLWTDVQVFVKAAELACDQEDPVEYEAAFALYTGDLLPDDRNEEWAIAQREALRALRATVLLKLARLYIAGRSYSRAIGVLERIVVDDAANEQAQRQLMRLHALLGHRHLALRHYQLLRDALEAELDAEPASATRQLYEDILAERFPPPRTRDKTPTADPIDVPPVPRTTEGTLHAGPQAPPLRRASDRARLIGREHELAEVRRQLGLTRLLTLIGDEGVGKSALARQVAEDLRDLYPDGVVMVDLSSVTEPGGLVQAVARAVGMAQRVGRSSIRSLVRLLHARESLLVLDHADDLLPACRRLITVLLRRTTLEILVTNGDALRIEAEITWRLAPLNVPPYDPAPVPAMLRRYDAIRLFMLRGRTRRPGFTLDHHNAVAIAEISRQLAGNPLAIEIVAAQLAAMPHGAPAPDLVGLVQTQDGAVPTPHQMLEVTIGWSEGLLSPPERMLLRRLAIFAGGWWEDAVIPVCADHQLTAGMVPYALAGLVEKSFVVCDHTGLYGLASPIRRFALAQLSALDDQEALRQRHSAHYLRTVGRHVDLLSGPERQQSIVRLISDWQNVQAILRRAIKTRDSETALRIGAAICHVYRVAGYVSEGRSWLQVVLSISRQAPERLRALRARVLHGAGELAHLDGDNVHATSLHIEALALSRALDDRRMMAAALISLATIARYAGDTATSAARYSDAVSDLEAAGDARELARALEMLAALREDEGSFRQAMALHGRARVLYEDLGDTRAATRSLGRMGADALPLGDYAQASQLLEEALLLSRQLGDEVASNDALLRLARLALAQGDTAMAETFLEEAQVLGGKLGAQDGMGIALRGLARVALLRGDLDAAKTLCEISEAVARELGATRDIAQAVLCRADITRASGNLAVAFVTYKESLASLHPVWERPDIGRGLVGMAAAALGLGDAHTAAQLLGMVAALQVHTEVQIEPDAAAEQRVLLSQTRAALGNAVTPPYEASRQLSLSAILAAAEGLRIEGRQAPARTNRDLSGRPLSTRERQIADLVAGGHSNHQIAELLDIAPRTVDSLVGRIFKKLEINDRRDLATRFASQAEG